MLMGKLLNVEYIKMNLKNINNLNLNFLIMKLFLHIYYHKIYIKVDIKMLLNQDILL